MMPKDADCKVFTAELRVFKIVSLDPEVNQNNATEILNFANA